MRINISSPFFELICEVKVRYLTGKRGIKAKKVKLEGMLLIIWKHGIILVEIALVYKIERKIIPFVPFSYLNYTLMYE